MKYILLLNLCFLLLGCEKKCEVCEVVYNGEVINKFESCDKDAMEISKELCEKTARSQKSECNCKMKDDDRLVEEPEIEVIETIVEARKYIGSFKNNEETLLISNNLNDELGLNMAIILDEVLKKSYAPNGFEQKKGYRIYKYNKN